MVYLVSYDLKSPGQDYPNLIAKLKQLGAVRVLLSQWAVERTESAADLRDSLAPLMDANDKLIVTEITNPGWAWRNLSDDAKPFFQKARTCR